MLKNLISLFAIILLFNTASYAKIALNKTSDTTIINVSITEKQRAMFYYTNEFGDTNAPFALYTKDKVKKLSISEPTLLIDAIHQIPFLIYPGEDLTLQVDPQGLPMLVDNKDPSRNNELYLFVDYYKSLKGKVSSILFVPPARPTLKSAADFQKVIDKAKNDSTMRFEFLKSYSKISQISASFNSYTYTLFKYLYVFDVLIPIYYPGVDAASLPIAYTSYLDSLNTMFECDDCISNPAYQRSAIGMQHYLIRNIKRDESRFLSYYDTVATSFKGETRRFLLFDLLKIYLPARLDNYGSRLDEFVVEKHDFYSEYLKKQSHLYNQFKPVEKSPKEIADVNGKRYSFDDLLAKYKGYVIYLDFWASWCVPCRVNMASAERLKASFKDKKIVFVDISIDANPSAWKGAMNDDHMDEKLNYLLLDFTNSAVINQFRIRTIPHYVVIDRNGEIIRYSADYPNSPKIANLLSKFLD